MHPILSTFFEAEIVGSKYSFYTPHPSWNTNPLSDLDHWGRFPSLRALKHCRSKSKGKDQKDSLIPPEVPNYASLLNRGRIYMRWKERFLVSDPDVKSVQGASFDGFYYISFSHATGAISGIYYALRSEEYQELDLKHIHDGGFVPAVELR